MKKKAISTAKVSLVSRQSLIRTALNKGYPSTFIILLFIPLASMIFCSCNRSNPKEFEGTIEYKVTIQRPSNSEIPVKQFNAMFQDTESKAELHVKKNYFRFDEFSLGSNNSTVYIPDSLKAYSFSSTSPTVVFWNNVNSDAYVNSISSVGKGHSESVMGKKCRSIIIKYENGMRTQVFYTDEFSIDTDQFANHRNGFLDYFYQAGALPLKIIISDEGVFHEVVFEATKVNKRTLEGDVFLLPMDVEYLNMDITE